MSENKDFGLFQIGTKVTIYSDELCKHPIKIGFVKRFGNEAWRLAKSDEWYASPKEDENIVPRNGYNPICTWAKIYEDGDEERIETENQLLQKKSGINQKIRSFEMMISGVKQRITNLNKDNSFCNSRIIEWKRNIKSFEEQMEGNLYRISKSEEEIKDLNNKIENLIQELKSLDNPNE